CRVCPRGCRVDRTAGELGYCRGGLLPRVASAGPHFGEEPPLAGRGGSGTIFLTGCNLRCAFCQNYGISQCYEGTEVSCERLARQMVALQDAGCHNINFVTPSHFVPQILAAVGVAVPLGLSIPLVYNSGGYDLPETIRLLDGVFDIYMPDAKYGDDATALALSDAPDYVRYNHGSMKEMHRQVGDLVIENGIAQRGLLIRHLVLPDDLAGTEEVMEFIAREISPDSYVNIMDQYHPAWNVFDEGHPLYRKLRRRISPEEYVHAVDCALRIGLHRGIPFDPGN
ncbi:MAG TPA: radical SAM protein, partial [Methanomicrobiales archaeon]|nr:radical SAM protein [Methanomicrobiales archaeon]